MATVLTSNAQYLAIDGTPIQAYLISVRMTRSNANSDVTHGIAGHEMVDPGLDSTSFDIEIAYVISDIATLIPLFTPGNKAYLTYGPEGNTPGKPRHYQLVKIDSFEMGQAAKKDAVTISVKATGAEAPVADIADGAVFS